MSIVVLSDSLAYYGPKGGLAADDERIWPNLVGQRLGAPVELFGRIGWTSRDIWWAVTQDPRIWAALPKAEVVVLAYGGMDSLPSPLPTALREQIRYLRPARLRQAVRDGYAWVQPRASRTGWPMALPPRVTIEYLEKVRGSLAHLRPDLPIVVCLPPTHASPYYGNVHAGRVPTTAAMRAWAAEHGLATVDFYPTTRDEFADHPDDMNPDGIHWGFRCHSDIAGLVAPVVGAALERTG
ncbi:hypothetical protein GOARA_062_00110 [Gordonia araii NBRC 100433]|uniref:SGNH hydrolase-type esterase domain-containing protein n=1 Tax=Gordonia araii NBRC 100433 TaxID=1073574 RepID=G7H4G8_9ACTN|nr:diglucosylglycerate octanoyltransferase [Gordonia araii]GAB10743.1 hypothetical protein GOARA_062_00110 [Gordonia araii NBRC 100433]